MTQTEPQNIPTIDLNGIEATQKIAYPDLKSTVTLFFVFILNNLIITLVAFALIGFDTLHLNSHLLKSILILVMYVTTLLITIQYAIRKSKKKQGNFLKISFNKIPGWLILLIIIGTLAMIVPLEQTSAWIPMPKSVQKYFANAFTKDIFSIITAVIAAPILEEILCRGIVLRGLLRNYTPYKAILISAIFFGAIHLNPWQAIPAFFAGAFLGWLYYKTQSVIPGIIIHTTINTTGVLFLFLSSPRQGLFDFLGTTYFMIVCLVSIMVFIASCIIIHRKVVITPEPVN